MPRSRREIAESYLSHPENSGYHKFELNHLSILIFMFGKPFRETKPEETSEATDLNQLSTNLAVDTDLGLDTDLAADTARRGVEQSQDTKLQLSEPQPEREIAESETPELINTVEKISRIVSPYFIAIVGLSLYQDNFLIGTILIGIGILSLLKVSTQDLTAFLAWIKNFLGFGESQS